MRSRKECIAENGDWGTDATVICSVCLSLTSIFAFIPLFLKAPINRFAAVAGSVPVSEVLTNNTLMS